MLSLQLPEFHFVDASVKITPHLINHLFRKLFNAVGAQHRFSFKGISDFSWTCEISSISKAVTRIHRAELSCLSGRLGL